MTEETLFASALEKNDPIERNAFLDAACGADMTLRRRLEQLLTAVRRTNGILEFNAYADPLRTPSDGDLPIAEDPGAEIGPYKLVRQIGEGGMGVVYLAEQEKPIRRQVALKIIKSGIDSKHFLARFEAERQALALMDHPNVAKVLDAGQSAPVATGETPRPYFVMELIDGVSITSFCDKERLSPRERLELFIPVCQAVQHAHQKGIIHRDLKPSNILVTQYDGRPAPKVIDFGVAKATGPRLTEQSVHTEVGLLIGTLEYMSPEQAELNNHDVDTRSDVYALGAVLYELLTGSVPFSRHELQTAGFVETLRIIKEVDPPKPSTKLSGSGTLASVAAVRQTEPKKLMALVRGELDWIAMKCLEKDRARRYESANGLARDVERYLRDEPVLAGPPSARYRLRKFARRHWRGVAAASAFALLLVTAVVTLAVALVAVNRERQEKVAALEAEAKRRKQARSALDVMSSQLIEGWLAKQSQLLPEHKLFLEQALRSYEEFAADTGQHEESRAGVAQAYSRVGLIRNRLGQSKEAEAAWQSSRELYAGLVADFSGTPAYRQDLAQVYIHLGSLYRNTGQAPQAEVALGRSLTILRQLAADFPDEPDYRRGLAVNLDHLGIVFKNLGQAQKAEEAYGQAVALLEPLVAAVPSQPDDRYHLAQVHQNLGVLFASVSRSREALEHHAQAVTLLEPLAAAIPEPRYRHALATYRNSQADGLRAAGRRHEAEEAFRQTLATRKQLVAEFPTVPEYREGLAMALNNLGILLKDTGRATEAEELYGQALAIHKQLAADFATVPDHRNNVAGAMVNLARLLGARQDLPGARRLLEEAVPYHEAALKASPGHPAYRRFYRINRWRMAETLLELKDHAAAADAAGQFLQAATEPARDAYTAAGLLAGCARLAAQDEHLPESQRQELATTYGASAVAALRLAIAKGAKEVAQMKTDPSLDPLRHRKDFQKLLADYEGMK